MNYGTSKPVLGEFFKITYIENPGMAFGINIGPKLFLTLFTIGASILIFIYIYRHRHHSLLLRTSLALILAGAIGNLIDRTFYGVIYNYAPFFEGRVVDFFQVEFWDFTFLGKTYTTWPIFNIADVSVTIGFLIILIFNKRAFPHHEYAEERYAENNESSDSVSNSQDEIIPQPGIGLNSNPDNLKFENPEENTVSSTGRSEEA
jgi:signal peptidase II